MGRAQQRCRAQGEDQERHRQHDRCEQEAEAGKHGLKEFCLGRNLRRPEAVGNAVMWNWPRSQDAASRESGSLKNTENDSGRSLNIERRGSTPTIHPRDGAFRRLLATSCWRLRCMRPSALDVISARRALDELAARARRLLRRPFHAQVEPASDSTASVHKMAESGAIAGICLECAAIFGHQPLTVRCRLGAIQE